MDARMGETTVNYTLLDSDFRGVLNQLQHGISATLKNTMKVELEGRRL